MEVLPALLTGLALGSIYGLIALGFHITASVCGAVNFAQGSSAMLGAVLLWMLTQAGWPVPAAVVIAVTACALYGLIVERAAIRPFLMRKSDAWLMATVALGLVCDNGVMLVFGAEPRSLPSPLAQDAVRVGGIDLGIYPLHLLIPLVMLALAGGSTCSAAAPCTAWPCSPWRRTATPPRSWAFRWAGSLLLLSACPRPLPSRECWWRRFPMSRPAWA
ncbi:branched-chain amino acid ABC transporter permease [Novosphingobium resinovorum]